MRYTDDKPFEYTVWYLSATTNRTIRFEAGIKDFDTAKEIAVDASKYCFTDGVWVEFCDYTKSLLDDDYITVVYNVRN